MTADYERGLSQLCDLGLGRWVDQLREQAQQTLTPSSHGLLSSWQSTVAQMPQPSVREYDLGRPAVTFQGDCNPHEQAAIRESLQTLHPWRKGPFELFGVFLDAEWRSDWKWSRVSQHLDLVDQTVLDVGCGNGYYGYRMLGAGARRVFGLEPYPLYNMQFAAIAHLAPPGLNHFVLPAGDRALTPRAAQELATFDVVFSMGVLYHSKDPFGHLQRLKQALRPAGTLVLETLVIDGDVNTVLLPGGRYAKMRNVWLLPSTLMLERMLVRSGFQDVRLVDTSVTTPAEQRRTEWMRFESLTEFLSPDDPARTIEGEPAPQRAVLIAQRP